MQCLLKCTEGEGFQLVTRPVPTPGPDQVIIKVHKVAICGSDLNLWKWNDLARTIATLPFIPGHEVTGEVVALGSEVTEVRLGQRVAVENHFYCTRCYQCKSGRGDICPNMSQYGHGRGTDQGGCCEYSCVCVKYCYTLTTNISQEHAAILEPMGVAHNAVENLSVCGEDVLVLGCGPIGLLTIPIIKAMGGKKVFAVDVNTERLTLALKMGADKVINSQKEDIKSVLRGELAEDTDGIGRIVEATGASDVINNCFSWLRKGGHIVLIGLPKAPIHIQNPITDLVLKAITLKSVHGRR
ncbi:hypothetical protein Pmani_015452 [Petrolisthes manimaculis]|uniref:Uncharacterized protein n=1 Tax=Petrolisthes manimaculis TaxID=1843537 RepID=A0AAE1UBL1_9EUCA|nr:hypothetical protein Pmani_015452 [Petrolisthes manimaculis]